MTLEEIKKFDHDREIKAYDKNINRISGGKSTSVELDARDVISKVVLKKSLAFKEDSNCSDSEVEIYRSGLLEGILLMTKILVNIEKVI